jgi:uridine kinase
MNPTHEVQLIAVVGGSGAGKGWLVERLCRLLGDKAAHLQLDNFYRDRSHLPMSRRARLNFDVPDAIDWDEAERVLRDCRAGRPTRVPFYDFATHSRVAARACNVWSPRPVVFVDGLWLLRRPAIRELFDLKIFLDTPTGMRCSRRLTRDSIERGYTRAAIEQQLRAAVLPMHNRYVEPQKKVADLVLTQPFRERDLVALIEALWSRLAHASLVHPWEHETFRAELVDLLANHEYCN